MRTTWILFLLLLPALLLAHHSSLLQSTTERTSIRGVISRVEWVNPHVQIYVEVIDGATRKPVMWRVETGSLNELAALSITPQDLRIGLEVTIRGARRNNTLETSATELPFAKQPDKR